MIETLLAKVGLPILVNIVADVLDGVDTPITKGASKALRDVDEAIKSGNIDAEQIAEANRHTEKITELQIRENISNLAAINETIRAEVVSQDQYVRRMRPTFGYIMAVTWGAQMLGLAYVMVFETARAGLVLNAMGNLTAIWAVGLSVLGIYVYKRSEDKKLISSSAIQNK